MMSQSPGRHLITAENHLNNRFQLITDEIRSSLLIIYILLPASCKAQDLNNKILMTVGGNEIQAGEFIRMYKKSPGTW